MGNGIDYYDARAIHFMSLYEFVTFEETHPLVLSFLLPPGDALDVGAGSGRDAAALASRGFRVVAVEPSRRMRELGRQRHSSDRIIWVDDQLPELRRLGARRFDFVLVSAVWMHLPPEARTPAMGRLSQLTRQAGSLVITLRIGAADPSRGIYTVDAKELRTLAEEAGLILKVEFAAPDIMGRTNVRWITQIFSHTPRLDEDKTHRRR